MRPILASGQARPETEELQDHSQIGIDRGGQFVVVNGVVGSVLMQRRKPSEDRGQLTQEIVQATVRREVSVARLVDVGRLEGPDRPAVIRVVTGRSDRERPPTWVSHALPMIPIENCVSVMESRLAVVWRKTSISSGAALPVSSVRRP